MAPICAVILTNGGCATMMWECYGAKIKGSVVRYLQYYGGCADDADNGRTMSSEQSCSHYNTRLNFRCPVVWNIHP